MVQKTRDITQTRIAAVETDEPMASSGTPLPTSGLEHADPERERELDDLLEKAWPSIEASMHYLRDR